MEPSHSRQEKINCARDAFVRVRTRVDLFDCMASTWFGCQRGQCPDTLLTKHPNHQTPRRLQVDKDGSGSIDLSELEYLLNLAGLYPSAAELDVLYQRFDRDKDGRISFEEFMEAMVDDWEEQEMEEEFQEIRELFTQLDKDGSQRLSVDELKDLIRRLGIDLKGGDMEDRVVEKLFRLMKGTRGGEFSTQGVTIDELATFLLTD